MALDARKPIAATRMEAFNEEEHEYETAEDIASSSDSDSNSEGELPPSKEQINKARKPPRGAASSGLTQQSRYALWRNPPRTIKERRQELLQLMGLHDEREYPKEGYTSDSSLGMSFSGTELDANEINNPKFSRSTLVSLLPASISSPASSESSNMISPLKSTVGRITSMSRSSGSYGHFASLQKRSGRNMQLQETKSGSASPTTRDIALERILDTSGAVLREATDHSVYSEAQKQLYISSLRRKQEKGLNSTHSLQEHCKEKLSIGSLPLQSKSEDLSTGPSSSSERSGDGDYHVEDLGCSVNQELVFRVKDPNTGKEFVVHESGTDGIWTKIKEISTGKELTLEAFERLLGLSPLVQEARKRERDAGVQGIIKLKSAEVDGSERKKRGLLRSLKNVARYVKGLKRMRLKDSSKEETAHENCCIHHDSFGSEDGLPSCQPQKVKVSAHKKSSKEFSDLYMVQEFRAHHGPIWALKFSIDGQYLATGGQDCVVRIYEIKYHHSVEDGENNLMGSDSSDARSDKTGSVKGLRNPLNKGDRKHTRTCSLGRSKNDNAKAIQLPKLFLIKQKALRCFHGHTEDVLDLAWSQSQFLVSSSMDKTVRLWHILHEECLKIFSHHDYVTCIEFNPVDDRYFLSGSLDDKLRIWNIIDHQVVDWVDLREMVTAACYTPDGKGAVVGSYKGTCRMYKLIGDKLQIEAHINVLSKKGKKFRGKKITGLQYMPGNPRKLLVTSSDSRIRVYDGLDLSCKLKGFRNANSHISASFSARGNYIVSASEDSRVYVWNTMFDTESASKAHQKHKGKSYEGFSSRNVTIAATWPGTAPFPALSRLKEESEAESCNQSGKGVSPYGPEDCESLSSVSSQNESCGGSSNCKITCRSSKPLTPYFYSPSRKGAGNDFVKFTPTNGMYASIDHGMQYNLCPIDETHFRQSLTTNISPVQSPCIRDSLMLDSGYFCVSKTCHLQSPGFEKCFGSCDNVSKASATWPEEKLPHCGNFTPHPDISRTISSTKFMTGDYLEETLRIAMPPMCDFVIATASLEGDLRTFQNYRVH